MAKLHVPTPSDTNCFQDEDLSARWATWILMIIVVLGIVCRVLFSIGIQLADSALYSDVAYSLADGSYRIEPSAYSLRYGLILPLALSYRLFGVNDYSIILWPLICSITCILACYFVCRFFGGRRAGLLAATLLAFLPLNIYQATDLHADLPMSTWLALALGLFLSGTRETTPKPELFFIAAGLFFGLAYLSKLTAVTFLPLLCVLWFFYRRIKQTKYTLITVATIMALEIIYYRTATGNSLFRISGELARGKHVEQVNIIYPNPLNNLLSAFIEIPVLLLKPYPITNYAFFGYIALLLPLALFWVFKTRRRAIYPLILWLGLIYLPLSFALLDFKTLIPAQIRYPRTLEPLCLPAMVLIALFLASKRWIWSVTVLAIIIPSSLYFSYILQFDSKQDIEPLRHAYRTAMVERKAGDVIVTDELTVFVLRYFNSYTDEGVFREFPEHLPTGLAILNPGSQRSIKKWINKNSPGWVENTEHWEKLYTAYSQTRVLGGTRERLFNKGIRAALFESKTDELSPITLYRIQKSDPLAGLPGKLER